MAFTDLVALAPLIQIVQNTQSQTNLATKDSTGANIDITGWNAFTFKVFQPGGNAAAAELLSIAPTLSGGSGSANLPLSAANSAAIPPGTFSYVLAGKRLVGDDMQVVARGTLVCNVGA
jgi:hypothetical protein